MLKRCAYFPVIQGGDAHIDPMGTIERAGDFHKNGAFRWDDVGIVPYELPGKMQKNCRRC